MKRVYVAGSYNGPDVLTVLKNMRKGFRACVDVLRAGFAPFCPWGDYHFTLAQTEYEKPLTIDDYYRYSMSWLRASEAVYVCNYREDSKGTKAEIEEAKRLGIPVYFTLKDLVDSEG
jgi:hypothetical protein